MKIKIDNYIFDASAKTIKFLDYDTIELERILLITNTTYNIIIYNFADATKGGSVSNDVLTLDYDTTSMSDTDKLLIFYQADDGTIESEKLNILKNIESIQLKVLIELKKVNKYFEMVTNTEIEEGDL